MLAKDLYHRRTEALKIRAEAAKISTLGEYPHHLANGEEITWRTAKNRIIAMLLAQLT
jgi:hypothetical protein